jgi:hypothetical protein
MGIKAFDPKKPGGPSNFGPRSQPHLNRFTPEELARAKYLESLPEGKAEGTNLGRPFRKLTQEEQAGGPQLKADRTVKLDPSEAGQVACTSCAKVFQAGDDVVLHDSETPAGQVPYCPACAKENPMKASIKFKAEFGLTPAYGRLKDLGALGYLTLDGVEDPGDSVPGGMNVQDWVIYRSNWMAASKVLPEGGVEGQGTFIKEHPGEEYPGDVVYEEGLINVYKGAASVVTAAEELVAELEGYPVLDEDSMSELEMEKLEEELDSWAMRDAEKELGYGNDPDDVLTDEEAAWLNSLSETDPERLALVEKGMELIYQLPPEKEQKLRRAVRDGLTYGDWTVVHFDQVRESLDESGDGDIADPEGTLHQFLAKEMQSAAPGGADDMRSKERAGQQRLFESLRLASNVVAGKREVKRLMAAGEAVTKAKSVANMVAKIIGVEPSVEAAGGGLIAFKVRKQLMAALFKAHADGSFSVSWAPMRLFASTEAAGLALVGHAMLSFDVTTKLRTISDALLQFKAAGNRFGVWNNYDEMPAFPDAFATEAEARAAADSLKERFRTQGFYKTNGGFKVPFEVLTVATHAENPDASFMIVPETDNPEAFAEYFGEDGEFEASLKRPTLMGRLRAKGGAGKTDDIGPASLKARNWARLQGYMAHAGADSLCAASRSRLSLWAKTPKGFEPVVKELKKKGDVANPWAVAWSMKNKGIKPKASKVMASDEDEADNLTNIEKREWLKSKGLYHPVSNPAKESDNDPDALFEKHKSRWMRERSKVKAGKSKGRFAVDQLVEGGPWWVLELGPSNQMTPFYGPFDTEEDANLKLDNMVSASKVKASDDDASGNVIGWDVEVEKEFDGRSDYYPMAKVLFSKGGSEEDLDPALVERLKKALVGKTVPASVKGDGYHDLDIEEGDLGPFSVQVADANDYRRSESSEVESNLQMNVEEAVMELLEAEFGAGSVDAGTLAYKAGS